MSTDKENKKNQPEQTNKKKDISNDLEKDAVGEFGSQNPTPQARTDQEQDEEQKKKQ
ncbi:hypothetical protein [Pontibacter diazotrophicus]|uniref:hypothetical protein n=1 Tax=Pontibacter diazotrophicus TaxID=1400979 RepID=UPI0015F140BC|nr:hypothetical protein [Pontibacter diazotrophicus]